MVQQPEKTNFSFIEQKFPTIHRLIRWLTWALPVATLAGLLGRWFFLFELCSHFPVQYVLLALVLLIYWFKRSTPLVVVLLFCLVWNSALVAPWLLAKRPTADRARDFRVLHSNVLYTQPDTRRIVDLIDQQTPNVFVLQEMTKASVQAVRAATKSRYPYQFSIWSKGPSRILVGSRTPFRIDRQAWFSNQTVNLQTTINGQTLSLITVHPRTPILPGWFRERNAHLAYVARLARRQTTPTLLIGDFNTTVWSPVYQDLIKESGLTACRRGFGIAPTWISWARVPFLMIPIDQALINNQLQTVNFQTAFLPRSDHRALVVDLAFQSR